MPVKEIRITVAAVSPELTESASRLLLHMFGGYYRTDGQGAFTFPDGRTVQESSVSWLIAVDSHNPDAAINMVRVFARGYCAAGAQECIYFTSVGGSVFFVDGNGIFNRPIEKG